VAPPTVVSSISVITPPLAVVEEYEVKVSVPPFGVVS
jgi:hypothetical protein